MGFLFLSYTISMKFEQPQTQETIQTNEGSVWQSMKKGIIGYLSSKMLSPLYHMRANPTYRAVANQQEEIASRKEASKMRISDVEIYNSALRVARQFGWNPGKENDPASEELEAVAAIDSQEDANDTESASIPLFITKKLRKDLLEFGVTEEEIYHLKPDEAWEVLQQKTLERDRLEEGDDMQVSEEDAIDDFEVLAKLWDDAYAKMQEKSDPDRVAVIEQVTVHTMNDPRQLEEYLLDQKNNLTQEEKEFIQLSIQMKKIKAKVAIELSEPDLEEALVTSEDFDAFVRTGEVSDEILTDIAKKIVSVTPMTVRELSVYMERSAQIESKVRDLALSNLF